MIPREILRKIRQIELRTNRIVNETLTADSLQTSAQFFRIASAVKHRDDADEFRLDGEVYTITVKDFHSRLTNNFAHKRKSFWVLKNSGKRLVNFSLKPLAQAKLLLVVPKNSIFEFESCLRVKDYSAGHARRCARRPLSSARTFSQVTPSSGFRRRRSARASNLAIISGGNSSLNSASMSWTTSHCSSNDIRRNCSRISVALIDSSLLVPQLFASA
jgi:hypothetical protein